MQRFMVDAYERHVDQRPELKERLDERAIVGGTVVAAFVMSGVLGMAVMQMLGWAQ